MIKSIKVLSLLNFSQTDQVSAVNPLFLQEFSWIESKTGYKPRQALLIPYAYKGTDYPAFFNAISGIFGAAGIQLDDVKDGNPATMIANAAMIVVAGGDVKLLTNALNQMTTASFNPYAAIKDRVDNSVPFMGWNEGSAFVSPEYFQPSDGSLHPGLNISPFQIVSNFVESDPYRLQLKNYLKMHTAIPKAVCQVDRADGSTIRLEESGSGMIDSFGGTNPRIIRYALVNNDLIEIT